MISLAVPRVDGNEAKYLQQCIDTNFVSTAGPFVNQFESEIAKITESNKAVATSSGTAALHLALEVSGVKRNDLVILPSFTFIASANAISYTGASPWLFDITSTSWTLNPDQVEEVLELETIKTDGGLIHKKSNRRIAAIMPVYTLGCPAEMQRFRVIADQYSLPLIADSAAALGAQIDNANLVGLADLTCFSFNGNKTFTCGGGGAVAGNDSKLLEKLKHISTTARANTDYLFDQIGYNFRLTNVNAAIGCAQLERLNDFLRIKKNIRQKYNQAFKDIPGVSLLPTPDYVSSTYWLSGIVLDEYSQDQYSDIIQQLNDEKIQVRPFWRPIHLQPPYKNCLIEKMSVTDKVWSKILILPCSTCITEEEQNSVINILISILKTF